MESYRQTDRDRPLPTLRVSPGQALSHQARNSRDNCDSVGDRTRSRHPHRRRPGARLVGRGARAVLALVLATAAAYAGGGVPTAWTASYTTVRVDAAPAYRHVLEDDDRLLLVQYSTAEDAQESEPVHGARGVIIQVLDDDMVVAQQTPPSDGYGLAAFYWSADDADNDFPWNDSDAQVRLSVNPLIDPEPASHTVDVSWEATDDTDETADELASDLKQIFTSIETNDPEIERGDYVSPSGITIQGQMLVIAAFPQLISIASEAFEFVRVPVGEDISFDKVEIGGLVIPRVTETFEDVVPAADPSGLSNTTLRPNGPGYVTELFKPHWTPQNCNANWECVDEAAADGIGSWLGAGGLAHVVNTDAYSLQDPSFSSPSTVTIVDVIAGARLYSPYEDTDPGSRAMLGVYLGGLSEIGSGLTISDTVLWEDYTQRLGRPGGGAWQVSDLDDLQVTVSLTHIRGLYVTQVWVRVVTGTPVSASVKLNARHYTSEMSGIVVIQTGVQGATRSQIDVTGLCSLGSDRRTLSCTGLHPYGDPSDLVVAYHSATEGEDGPFMSSVKASFGALGIPWAAGRVLFVGVIIAAMIGFNVSLFKGSTHFLVIAWTGDILFYAARAGALPWAPILLVLFLVVIAGGIGVFKRVTL